MITEPDLTAYLAFQETFDLVTAYKDGFGVDVDIDLLARYDVRPGQASQ